MSEDLEFSGLHPVDLDTDGGRRRALLLSIVSHNSRRIRGLHDGDHVAVVWPLYVCLGCGGSGFEVLAVSSAIAAAAAAAIVHAETVVHVTSHRPRLARVTGRLEPERTRRVRTHVGHRRTPRDGRHVGRRTATGVYRGGTIRPMITIVATADGRCGRHLKKALV